VNNLLKHRRKAAQASGQPKNKRKKEKKEMAQNKPQEAKGYSLN